MARTKSSPFLFHRERPLHNRGQITLFESCFHSPGKNKIGSGCIGNEDCVFGILKNIQNYQGNKISSPNRLKLTRITVEELKKLVLTSVYFLYRV